MDKRAIPTFIQASTEFNISLPEIIAYLVEQGFEINKDSTNEKLTEEMYKRLLSNFPIQKADPEFTMDNIRVKLEGLNVKGKISIPNNEKNNPVIPKKDTPEELALKLNLPQEINLENLQKGLKYIGLNLSRFETVRKELYPELIDLFKIAVDVNPNTTSKFTKMDLRTKLEKLLRGQTVKNHNNSVIAVTKSEKRVGPPQQKNITHQSSNPARHTIGVSENKKLGKVKFFDSSKGFGYVNSYDDKKDCFVHATKLSTAAIGEDDIVIFETVDSRKKPGELDVIKVSNKIPVFINPRNLHQNLLLILYLIIIW